MRLRFFSLAAAVLLLSPLVGAARPVFDGDADGVPDEQDRCLYSPRGFVVGPDGCSTPGDEDEDGVPERSDACPLSPAGAIVDAQGCALDSDVDGVADGIDVCPVSTLGIVVDARGCGAGEKARAPVARRPAPAVPVPLPASSAVVSSPAASATPPAPAVVTHATAPIAVATEAASSSTAAHTFYFDGGSAQLSWSTSHAIRASAADLLSALEKDPNVALMLSGHADTKSDGRDAPRLAGARATAVKVALIAAGIPAHRLTVRVPGVGEPRFRGEELERNCRVELRTVPWQARVAAPVPAAAAAPATPRVPASAAPAAATTPVGAPAATPPPETALRDGALMIGFAPYSAVLDSSALGAMKRFVTDSTRPLLADAAARVVVVAGIESGETGAAALRLAESRAASVMSALIALGLPRNRIEFAADRQTGARRADLRLQSG